MRQIALSEASRRFLTEEIGSVERLSLLLLMHRHPARWWTAETLAAELEMRAGAAQSSLEHLSARNLLDVRIAESVIYCYKPGREELSQIVEEIARAHYLHRDGVVAILTGRLTDSARLFADAFQIRKGKRDG